MASTCPASLCAALAICLLGGTPARAADPSWRLNAVYTADVVGAVAGDAKHAGRVLDNLDLILDGDLEKAAGWRGASFHLYVLNNSGGRPNEIIDTLQGVDSIEVEHARLRLYELWVEQRFAGDLASVRTGLYDLGSEFYTMAAAQLLLAPQFGAGSEFAETGPNGPSMFPATSLAVRLKAGGETGAYVQGAIVGADAGTLNELNHLSLGLDQGAIVIAEIGVQGDRRLSLGAWAYTRGQPELQATDADGAPRRAKPYGVYVLAENTLWRGGRERRRVSGFLAAGVSDGRTTPFSGGWQAGLLARAVLPGRPHSAASIGLQQAFLSPQGRRAVRDSGGDPATAESGLEITYSDSVGRLSIQPDLQLIRRPGGDRRRDLALVAALRFTLVLQ
jgi:porin